tara:strand:+ start:1050 stop:1526 length:477 start_codon:yes stop_codon:yes gene_type:complete
MLKNILDTLNISINTILADKISIFITLLCILLFSCIAYLIYTKLINENKHLSNREFIKKNKNNNDVIIYFFFTEWCPYCKKALPEWEKFTDYVNNINESNDYNVKLINIDCDKDKKTADKYKIEGYPSIKLLYKGNEYDYEAKVENENLIKFLETSIS